MGVSTTSNGLVTGKLPAGRMLLCLHLAAFAAALAIASPSAHADLLTNGNLNTDVDGVAGPDNWNNWQYGNTSFAAYKNDPANDAFDFDATPYVNAGNYGDWWSSGGGWNQTLAGNTGVPYTFTAFSATEGWDNAAGEIRIIYLGEFATELQREVRHVADYHANAPWSPYTMTSIAPEGTIEVKVEFATWGARGSVMWDNATLQTASVWNVDAGGDFASASNWLGGTPGGVDAAARFLGAITDNRTVAVDSAVTLGSISFVNAKSYELAGAGSLRLESSAGESLVDVQTGSQTINLPTTLASNTNFAVSSGATLNINDPLTIAAGKSLKPSGGGLVQYNSTVSLGAGASILFGNSTHATGLTLASGANASIAARGTAVQRVVTVDAISTAADAKIDIADNKLVVNYTGANPAATIRSRLASGYNGGAWNGLGISSSLATDGKHAIGMSDSGSSITLQYALNADATLDEKVNFDDLVVLAQNYNATSGASWSKGDFNYDNAIDFGDLVILAQNYGSGVPAPGAVPANIAADWAAALALVPEPTSIAAIGLSMSLFAARRRQPVSNV